MVTCSSVGLSFLLLAAHLAFTGPSQAVTREAHAAHAAHAAHTAHAAHASYDMLPSFKATTVSQLSLKPRKVAELRAAAAAAAATAAAAAGAAQVTSSRVASQPGAGMSASERQLAGGVVIPRELLPVHLMPANADKAIRRNGSYRWVIQSCDR